MHNSKDKPGREPLGWVAMTWLLCPVTSPAARAPPLRTTSGFFRQVLEGLVCFTKVTLARCSMQSLGADCQVLNHHQAQLRRSAGWPKAKQALAKPCNHWLSVTCKGRWSVHQRPLPLSCMHAPARMRGTRTSSIVTCRVVQNAGNLSPRAHLSGSLGPPAPHFLDWVSACCLKQKWGEGWG